MSTAQTLSPDTPLRPVWTPHDAQETLRAVQAEKTRWGAFLSAKNALLTHAHAGAAKLADVMERLHLGVFVRLAQRSIGWLPAGAGMVRRGLRAPGARPAVVWLLTTGLGQSLVKLIVRPVVATARQVGGALLWTATSALNLLGDRGRRLSQSLQARVLKARTAAARRAVVGAVAAQVVLDPAGLPMQTVATVAKARMLDQLVRRYLPMPWRLAARVLVNAAMVPAAVWRQAARVVLGAKSAPVAPQQAAAPSVEPEDDPTPPAAPAALRPEPIERATPSPVFIGPLTEAEMSAQSMEREEPEAAVFELFLEPEVPQEPTSAEADVENLTSVAVAGGGSPQRYPAQKRRSNKRKR